MIFVDTNIVIDLREDGSSWQGWSYDAVADARLSSAVVVSVITIGELASREATLTELLQLTTGLGLDVLPLSAEAAHRAGRAQRAYRAAGGRREKLLADFLIGGAADTLGASLLTRDPRHYRTYFPDLTLITPETDA